MANLLLTAVKLIASSMTINPRVLEFGLHYISGKQTEMNLNEKEIEYTKNQILKGFDDHIMMNESGIDFENEDEEATTSEMEIGIASIHNSFCESGEKNSWFTHTTRGVVGGFNYSLSVVDGNVIADCIDTWDFNAVPEALTLSMPAKLSKLIEMVAKCVKVPVSIKVDSVRGTARVSIKEEDLLPLNATRAFKTLWQVNLGSQIEFETKYSKYVNIVYVS